MTTHGIVVVFNDFIFIIFIEPREERLSVFPCPRIVLSLIITPFALKHKLANNLIIKYFHIPKWVNKDGVN
jgi:hypothetical protein